MNPRILFQICVPGEPRQAGRQQSIRVCYHLAKQGARVTLHLWTDFFDSPGAVFDYFGLPPEPNLELVIHKTRCGTNTSPKKVWLMGMLWHVRRLMRLILSSEKKKYDLYYGRGRRYPGVHVLLKRLLKYKILVECHEVVYLDQVAEDDLLNVQPRFDLEKIAYQGADGVICITHALKDLLEKKWGAVDPVTVIPSGGQFRESSARPADRPIEKVCFVGNPYPFSGIDDVVRAMAKLPEPIRLEIVGGKGTDLDRLRDLIGELKLGDRVRLTGYVKPTELPAMYETADVLVMPLRDATRTRYFVSPLKVFEYMTARRAIVASDLPTSREVLTHDANALLCTPGDPGSFAAAIRRITDDAALASRLAERSYADAQRYTLEKKCAQMLGFIQTLIDT